MECTTKSTKLRRHFTAGFTTKNTKSTKGKKAGRLTPSGMHHEEHEAWVPLYCGIHHEEHEEHEGGKGDSEVAPRRARRARRGRRLGGLRRVECTTKSTKLRRHFTAGFTTKNTKSTKGKKETGRLTPSGRLHHEEHEGGRRLGGLRRMECNAKRGKDLS